jgi:hypothetical protein
MATKQITRAQFISEQVEERFFQDYAELFAHFNIKDFMESLSAYLGLNYSLDELRAAPTTPSAYRNILSLAAITLINREAIMPLTSYNKLAEEDLHKLRLETGIDVNEILSVIPPPTEAELLEQEVRSDWRTLSMDKVRQKKNASRKYSETLERLANAGTLESSVTALTRAGA